jgi:hypothetical protein
VTASTCRLFTVARASDAFLNGLGNRNQIRKIEDRSDSAQWSVTGPYVVGQPPAIQYDIDTMLATKSASSHIAKLNKDMEFSSISLRNELSRS